MFMNCTALKDISVLENWQTAGVINMCGMFCGCTALKSVSPLEKWDTSSVANISQMFRSCTAIEDVSVLKNWHTSGIRNMSQTFRGCTALRNISGLENWDIKRVEKMDLMFTDCHSLESYEDLLKKWQSASRQYIGLGLSTKVVSEERVFINSDGPMACPHEGEFIGWKKCRGEKIVKLLIPADAKRSSALSKKCRCNRAVVLDITDRKGTREETAVSGHDSRFVYRKGETVCVPNFDEDRFNECAPGIHFFMDKEDAENYY